MEDQEGKTAAGGPTFACGYTGRNNWVARQTMQPRVPVPEKKALKLLAVKILWGLRRQEKLSASQESSLEGPTGSKNIHKPTHPPRNQCQKGPICLWVLGEVTKSLLRAKRAALFPL